MAHPSTNPLETLLKQLMHHETIFIMEQQYGTFVCQSTELSCTRNDPANRRLRWNLSLAPIDHHLMGGHPVGRCD